jgi:pimeloyl-ACP methyl ester carboxylesterase
MIERTRLLAVAAISAGLLACSSSDDAPSPSTTERADAAAESGTTNAPFVLVHGAFMGAWAWDDVATGLRARGAAVTVVELPAHGGDTSPAASATLDAYVTQVGKAIDGASAPVVLVAHSMAGIVATQVAEQKPEKVGKLVYLAAYVPKDGETLQAIAAGDKDSRLGPLLRVDGAAGTASLPKDKLKEIFCADCDAAAEGRIASAYRDEPIAPFGAPVHATPAAWGRVPKFYVFTKNDNAVSYPLQRRMTDGVTWAGAATLDTSHSPFLSRPDEVVSTLLGF